MPRSKNATAAAKSPRACRNCPSTRRAAAEVRHTVKGPVRKILGKLEMTAIDEIEQLGCGQRQQRVGVDERQAIQHGCLDLALDLVALIAADAGEGIGEDEARKQMQAPLQGNIRTGRIRRPRVTQLQPFLQPVRIGGRQQGRRLAQADFVRLIGGCAKPLRGLGQIALQCLDDADRGAFHLRNNRGHRGVAELEPESPDNAP
jgi:hypothetical protein